MHLVINATELGRQRGGNESYIAGVIKGLDEIAPPFQITLITCNWGKRLDLPASFQQVNLGNYHRLPFFLWQQTLALRQLEADWYLANFFLPPVLPCNGAVVVHDLSFRAHPDYYPRTISWYMNWLTRLAVRQAGCVFTVSEFSRQELFRFYSIHQEKVIVVPNGVGTEFQPLITTSPETSEQTTLSRYGIEKPFIFAIGNIHPRKNLANLLKAYLLLKARKKSAPTMVWAGLKRWESEALVEQARAAGVALTGFIAQEDLPTFYRQAEMLVYPSLYEGFGLPPVEAMACGTPVVTSNTTSLPEVVGEAALTVNVTNPEEIAAAMLELLDNKPLRQRLQQAGLERAGQFTWSRTAQRLLAALTQGNHSPE